HESLQVRPRQRAQVEAAEHRVAELDQPQREAIPARLRHVLDETRRGQRREQARYRTRVDPRPASDLVRPELTTVREGIEHRKRPLDGGDVADCWSTAAGNDMLLLPILAHCCP